MSFHLSWRPIIAWSSIFPAGIKPFPCSWQLSRREGIIETTEKIFLVSNKERMSLPS